MKRLLLLVLLLIPCRAFATDFYTSTTGSDTGGNTCANPASPCNISNGFAYEMGKITAANTDFLYLCNAACDGDGVRVRTAVNIDTNSYIIPSGTTFANALTIKAYPGELIALARVSLGQGNATHHVIFSDFELDCQCTDGSAIFYIFGTDTGFPGAHHIRVQRIVGHDAQNTAVGFGDGLYPSGFTSGNEWLDNEIYDSGTSVQYDHCMYLNSGIGDIVDGNRFHDCPASGLQTSIDGEFHGMGSGVYPTDTIIRNNRSYNNHVGMLIYGKTNQVYNNVIYDNTDLGLGGAGGTGIGVGGYGGHYIYGNTIVNNTNCYNNALMKVDHVFNNICWHNSDSNTFSYESDAGTNLLDPIDPVFTDEGADDYTLGVTSPALNNGTDLGSTYATDIDGASRPQGAGWDIGAYERAPGAGGSNSHDAPTVTENCTGGAADLGGGTWDQLTNSTGTVRTDGSGRCTGSVGSDSVSLVVRPASGTYSNAFVQLTAHSLGTSTDGTSYPTLGCHTGDTNGNRDGIEFNSYTIAGTTIRAVYTLANGTATYRGGSNLAFSADETESLEWEPTTGRLLAFVGSTNVADLNLLSLSLPACRPSFGANGDATVDAVTMGTMNGGSVAGGTLTVTLPGTGSTCTSGQTCPITWTSSGITGTIDCGYLVGGNYYSVATPAYDAGSYDWTVNAPASTSAQVRCKQGAVMDDGSTFTIYGTKSQFIN